MPSPTRPNLVGEAGYVPLPDKIYLLGRERVAKGITGSIFEGHGSQGGSQAEGTSAGRKKGSTEGRRARVPADTAAAPARGLRIDLLRHGAKRAVKTQKRLTRKQRTRRATPG